MDGGINASLKWLLLLCRNYSLNCDSVKQTIQTGKKKKPQHGHLSLCNVKHLTLSTER